MFRNKSILVALTIALAALSVIGVWSAFAAPQPAPVAPAPLSAGSVMGTGFTYQGRLLVDGAKANGDYGMTFRLYDALTGGAQIGSDIIQTVPVSQGLFTVELDFGQEVFVGQARWLEIVVGTETLTPRQELTPAPYALALPGLWTQENATSPNLIGGYYSNTVGTGVVGATIGGGGHSGSNVNKVNANYGVIGGGDKNTVGCLNGAIAGGNNNQAVGRYAFIGGGKDNVSGSGTCLDLGETTIGGGVGNSVTGERATIAGGYNNNATATQSAIGGGGTNTASGTNSTVAGGSNNMASKAYATVPGGNQAAATHYGEMAYASGDFAAVGDAQSSLYVLRGTTVNDTAKELSLDDATTPIEFITIAAGRTVAFEIQVIGRNSNASGSDVEGGYLIRGAIQNKGGAVSFVGGSNPNTDIITLGETDAGLGVAVVADDTNDRLAVTVTGLAATNIRWVATVRTTEVSFP